MFVCKGKRFDILFYLSLSGNVLHLLMGFCNYQLKTVLSILQFDEQ